MCQSYALTDELFMTETVLKKNFWCSQSLKRYYSRWFQKMIKKSGILEGRFQREQNKNWGMTQNFYPHTQCLFLMLFLFFSVCFLVRVCVPILSPLTSFVMMVIKNSYNVYVQRRTWWYCSAGKLFTWQTGVLFCFMSNARKPIKSIHFSCLYYSCIWLPVLKKYLPS